VPETTVNTPENYKQNPYVTESKNGQICCHCCGCTDLRSGTIGLGVVTMIVGLIFLIWPGVWYGTMLNAICGIFMIAGAYSYSLWIMRGVQVYLFLMCLAVAGYSVLLWLLFGLHCGDGAMDSDETWTEDAVEIDFACLVIIPAMGTLFVAAFQFWCFVVASNLVSAYQRAKQLGASRPVQACCA
jgi:hypothetical protein